MAMIIREKLKREEDKRKYCEDQAIQEVSLEIEQKGSNDCLSDDKAPKSEAQIAQSSENQATTEEKQDLASDSLENSKK